jgi:hypothetical protein
VAIVTPPLARAPLHSLVRAVDTTRDADPDWERGMQYAPEATGGYRALSGCTAQVLDYGADDGPAPVVDYQPWELEVQDPCPTTFGYDEAAVTARMQRAFDAVESYGIAHELWTADLSVADSDAGAGRDPNPALTRGPTVLGTGPVNPRRGLGMLEAAIGDALRGQQATLHISRTARPFFPELVKVGQLLYTNIDNLIVADAGYPGSAPEGAADAPDVAWIYATGPVVVRRSPLFMGPTALNETVDQATNTIRRTASKVVAATFDPAALFAVPITLA